MIIRIIQDNFGEVYGVYSLNLPESNLGLYSSKFTSWVDFLIAGVCGSKKIQYLYYKEWSIEKNQPEIEPYCWDWLWYSPKISKKTLKDMRAGGGQIWLKPYYGQNLARVSNLRKNSILDNESDFFETGTF